MRIDEKTEGLKRLSNGDYVRNFSPFKALRTATEGRSSKDISSVPNSILCAILYSIFLSSLYPTGTPARVYFGRISRRPRLF